jgi:transcriptional regulator with XRE-family HTH domain
VGRRIAELRRLRGWTQAEMAERMGHSDGHQSSVERGIYNMTLDTLTMFAQVLRVKPAELLRPPKSRAKRKPGRPRKDEKG